MQARSRYHQTAGTTVEVLAIVAKSRAEAWLAQFGYPEMTEVPLSEVKDERSWSGCRRSAQAGMV